MQNKRRLFLEEVGKVLGVSAPVAASEQDSGEETAANAAPTGILNPPLKQGKSPLDMFATRVRKALSSYNGTSFPVEGEGGKAGLEIIEFRPAVIHYRDDSPFLVVPVRVRYVGQAKPEQWAKVDKALESAVKDSILANASIENTGMTNLILRKRRKTDPYEGEDSLTILRFGLA